MKLILDINDNKLLFILELLQNFSFVKTEAISEEKANFLTELQGSINEVNLAKEGKLKLKTAEELLNEL